MSRIVGKVFPVENITEETLENGAGKITEEITEEILEPKSKRKPKSTAKTKE